MLLKTINIYSGIEKRENEDVKCKTKMLSTTFVGNNKIRIKIRLMRGMH